MKKSALGRGLGALISDVDNMPFNNRTGVSETPATPASIAEIPIDKVCANPYQPRSTFDEDALAELADSIKNLGVIQPITVRMTDDGKYQIISGERRFRAATLAGMTAIPAYIRKADDQGMLEMAIVENIQRENLDAIEIAQSFQRLIEECSLTQEAMAERVGKKRATITNYLRLLRLPPEIQLAIRAKALSMGHARALLAIDSPKKQLKLCNQIIEQDLSVRQVEDKIRKMSVEDAPKQASEETGDDNQELEEAFIRLLEIFGKYFNNNISLKRGDNGSGSFTIHFNENGEVFDFLKALEKTNI
jgi:ParB family transcriptional regulator, chromosome partitioning protein